MIDRNSRKNLELGIRLANAYPWNNEAKVLATVEEGANVEVFDEVSISLADKLCVVLSHFVTQFFFKQEFLLKRRNGEGK